jgi:hypothetical protein
MKAKLIIRDRAWMTNILMAGLIVLFWFVDGGVALRYFVLFVGVMSCMYVLWDVIDDTIAQKVNGSDASAFAHVCGCFPSQGMQYSHQTECIMHYAHELMY